MTDIHAKTRQELRAHLDEQVTAFVKKIAVLSKWLNMRPAKVPLAIKAVMYQDTFNVVQLLIMGGATLQGDERFQHAIALSAPCQLTIMAKTTPDGLPKMGMIVEFMDLAWVAIWLLCRKRDLIVWDDSFLARVIAQQWGRE